MTACGKTLRNKTFAVHFLRVLPKWTYRIFKRNWFLAKLNFEMNPSWIHLFFVIA